MPVVLVSHPSSSDSGASASSNQSLVPQVFSIKYQARLREIKHVLIPRYICLFILFAGTLPEYSVEPVLASVEM